MLQRVIRRRGALLAIIVIPAIVITIVVGTFYKSLPEALLSIFNDKCQWLPSFSCQKVVEPPQEDPLPPLTIYDEPEGNGLIVDTEKAKLDFINLAYAGKRGQPLRIGHKFYANIMSVIRAAQPACEKLDNYPNGPIQADLIEIATGSKGRVFSQKHLSEALKLDKTQKDLMIASHKYALDNLPDSAPDGLYLGTGIAYVGGGRFNWMVLLSLRKLRATGCQLPVEIFIPKLEQYELELCSAVFPLLNARCVHIPTALYEDQKAATFKFGGYQYKCLAMMLSSFENVLLLDSDNIPVRRPESIFKNEPFISKGLIVWPDYWHRTTSPDYYDIAGIEVSKTKVLPKYHEKPGESIEMEQPGEGFDWLNYPYHERAGAMPDPSSESGQLVISKKTHMKALLLALYYNLYGPDYYYPLFTQGTHGEGDKETFLAAAVVTNKPYYQIQRFVGALGNLRDGKFNGNGMGQHDPVQDYKWTTERRKLRQQLKGADFHAAASQVHEPRFLFVHANHPKLDPWLLLKENHIMDENGERRRLYGWDLKERVGTDLELDLWDYMDQLLCYWRLNVDHFKDLDRDDLCKKVREHRDWLRSTSNPEQDLHE